MSTTNWITDNREKNVTKVCSEVVFFEVDRYNNTVVHHAAMHGTSEIISYIIDNGGKLSNSNTKVCLKYLLSKLFSIGKL